MKQVQFSAGRDVSGQTAFDKFARRVPSEIRQFEQIKDTELNGVEEGKNSVREQDLENRRTQKDRAEHEATHVLV